MIEGYFAAGAQFSWRKPNDGQQDDVNPGSFVASRSFPSPLLFKGMNDLSSSFAKKLHMGGSRPPRGLQQDQAIAHDWLDYTPGHTAIKRNVAQDCLTGYMSGCRIIITYDRGVRCLGHVGTKTGEAELNQTVRRAFAAEIQDNTIGFNPSGDLFPLSEISTLRDRLGKAVGLPGSEFESNIIAAVTANDQCYEVLLFSSGKLSTRLGYPAVVSGGAKRSALISRADLHASMMK